jgi:hypothetical protein
MSTPPDGGPAFPQPLDEIVPGQMRPHSAYFEMPHPGMSLRAYLAGQALPAILMGDMELAKLGGSVRCWQD